MKQNAWMWGAASLFALTMASAGCGDDDDDSGTQIDASIGGDPDASAGGDIDSSVVEDPDAASSGDPDAAVPDAAVPDASPPDAGGDTAEAVCGVLCPFIAECFGEEPDPVCLTECTEDLLDCLATELDDLAACATGSCDDIGTCIVAVECVGGGEEPCHDECVPGGPLDPSCGECATLVCDADPFCCESGWDDVCEDLAQDLCGLDCPVECGDGDCDFEAEGETCPEDCGPVIANPFRFSR